MRKVLWILSAISLVLFVLLLSQISWSDAVRAISNAKASYIVGYLAVSATILLLGALRWHIILRAKEIRAPFVATLGAHLSGYAVSFVTPGPKVGGEPVRAGIIARKRASFGKAFSTVLLDKMVAMQVFSVLFFSFILFFTLNGSMPATLAVPLIIVSALFLACAMVFAYLSATGSPLSLTLARKLPLPKKVHDELDTFRLAIRSFYRADRGPFVASHCIAAVAWLLSLVEYKFLLLILGFDVGWGGVFIVFSLIGIAYAIPIPLALGTLEAGQVAAFSVLGLPGGAGVLLALITRLRDISFTLIGFMTLLYYGTFGSEKKIR